MQRRYLTPESCDVISLAIREKHMKYKDVAELIGKSESTICRLCTGKAKWVESDVIKNLETILDIHILTVSVPDVLDGSDEMIQELIKLRAENKMLKRLLIEKWSKEVDSYE